MEGLLIRAVDRLVAVGHEQRRQVQTTYRLPDSALRVIWNGVAPVAPAEQAAAFRARLGTGDRLLVGTVAKLIEQKGLDDLLAVARKCLDQRYAMQFVIVGDGPLRNSLEQRRRELGLDESVVITGWIPNAAAAAVPAFDVFFQPSRWEAMSIAILEAMAAGKPIVATRVGDNAHALAHQVTGLLVDSGDVPSMIDALGQMNDRDLRQRLGDAAREHFQRQFTVDRMITSYEQLYSDVV
jgi:glycosyltransferase involved in cell wall biosynthesis